MTIVSLPYSIVLYERGETEVSKLVIILIWHKNSKLVVQQKSPYSNGDATFKGKHVYECMSMLVGKGWKEVERGDWSYANSLEL